MISVSDLVAVTGATEADGPRLEELERNALAFVQIQTDRYFGPPEEVTEYLAGTGTRRLWLRDHVVIPADEYEPAAVVEERAYPGGTATEIEVDAFALRQTDREFPLVLLGDGVVWTRDYEYAVTYTRGYPTNEPGDIRQLVLDLVSVRWGLRGHEGLRSEAIGTLYSYTRFGDTDLDSVMGGHSTIDAWRRPVYA